MGGGFTKEKQSIKTKFKMKILLQDNIPNAYCKRKYDVIKSEM